jgi:hypothetical protein
MSGLGVAIGFFLGSFAASGTNQEERSPVEHGVRFDITKGGNGADSSGTFFRLTPRSRSTSKNVASLRASFGTSFRTIFVSCVVGDVPTTSCIEYPSGSLVGVFKGEFVRVSNDEKLIATKLPNKLMVWEIPTGKMLVELESDHPDRSYFASDGKKMGYVDGNRMARVVCSRSGKVDREYLIVRHGENANLHTGDVGVFSNDLKLAAIVRIPANRIEITEWRSRREICRIEGFPSKKDCSFDLIFSSCGKYLFGNEDVRGTQYHAIWKAQTGKRCVGADLRLFRVEHP